MGNDWSDGINKGGRPRRWLVIILFAVLIMVSIIASCSPSLTRIPRGQNASPQVTVSTLPGLETTHAPTLTPKPTTLKPTMIYVVANNVPAYWSVDAVLVGWKSAKFTDFKRTQTCLTDPCVTVRVNKALPIDTAALTTFTNQDIYIDLNPAVTSKREAESSLAHEFGHVLGAPHIVGTLDTVMSPIGVYQLLPTKLDIQTVDRLGQWENEKMYENSGKTLDMRRVPN